MRECTTRNRASCEVIDLQSRRVLRRATADSECLQLLADLLALASAGEVRGLVIGADLPCCKDGARLHVAGSYAEDPAGAANVAARLLAVFVAQQEDAASDA
jgi:hypothetical protein